MASEKLYGNTLNNIFSKIGAKHKQLSFCIHSAFRIIMPLQKSCHMPFLNLVHPFILADSPVTSQF